MRIRYLPLLLSVFVSLSVAGCGQTDVKSQSNETKTTETKTTLLKEIEIPANIKESNYEANPAQDSLLLTLNSDKQLYYRDKLINDQTLKAVLKEFAAKTKKLPSKKSMPAYLLNYDKVNPFYFKADAGLPFAEIVNVLKIVRESSPHEYRIKFIVKSEKEAGKMAQTPDGRYVINVDMSAPAPETNLPPRPNPLMLVAKLDAAGKIKLNYEPPMEIGELKPFLSKILKQREANGVFAEGTNEVVKTITLATEPNVKYGDVIKIIDELYGMGAKPVEFGELSDEYQSRPIAVNPN